MALTPQIVAQVQRSFKEISPMADQVGVLFYELLFRRNPELRALFDQDMGTQARKIMQMLELMVNALPRFDDVVPALREFARRHRDYGVVDAHYPMVGEALIWTLAQVQGPRFTCELEHAWHTVYQAIAGAMMAAGHEANAPMK
jgi:hemoglobin-like flavoprotein